MLISAIHNADVTINLRYDKTQYLCTTIGFPPGGSDPYACTQKSRTVTGIRRKNTDNRTHEIEIKTYKTIEQNKNNITN